MAVAETEKKNAATLFIKNLPEDATKDQLELVFSEVGKVRHCFVVKNRRTEHFKGIGFVTFANEDDVKSALKKNFKLGSNQLNVTLAEDKKKKDPGAKPVSFTKEAKLDRKLQKSRLIVRNLSFKANEEDLKKTFGKFGEIMHVNIPKKEDGKMRGFAFVQFKQTPDAIKAVKELNMKDIKGRVVAVDFTVPKGKFEEVRNAKQQAEKTSKNRKGSLEGEAEKSESDNDANEDDDSSSDEEDQPSSTKRKASESSSSTDDDESSDEADEFEKKHLQKNVKKISKKAQLRANNDESDSEVEFGSDGEVRVVGKNDVKDTKRILKKKKITPAEEEEDDDEEEEQAMEVDEEEDTHDDDSDDSDEDTTKKEGDKPAEKGDKPAKTDKNKKANKKDDDSDSDWGHTPNDDSSEEEEDEDREKAKRKAEMIKKEDLSRTVFVQNIPFDTTQKTFQEHMKKYGPFKFCLLTMDKVLGRSKGTGFVKFNERTDAEKCVTSLTNGELALEGKMLSGSIALKRDKVKEEYEKKHDAKKQPKDKRNLFLAREGFIRAGTTVAAGVSDHDLKLRAKLEANKKKALKNLHNFVSTTRLCVHNLPPSCDDKQLRRIFASVVDRSAKITEARVMRNMKRLSHDGQATSKGFGFVNFEKHEDALKAFRAVNNNPDVFTDSMRPVVSFSIENRAALLAKERRLQRSREKLIELKQMKKGVPSTTEDAELDYSEGNRFPFEGLRAQTDMKTLPRRVGEKVRLDPKRRQHQMKVKRLAKKSKKQPEFKKKKQKQMRGPTKAQIKERNSDKTLNEMIAKRRKKLQSVNE